MKDHKERSICGPHSSRIRQAEPAHRGSERSKRRSSGKSTITVLKIAVGALCATLLLAGSAQAAVRNVSAGLWRTCAAMSGGEVDCWGVGYRVEGAPHVVNDGPTPVAGISGATSAATNVHYTCALLASGEVVCFGDGGYGQLGNGSFNDSATPVNVSGLSDAVSIALGGYHACALRATGGVDCWGRNDRGELGNGTLTNSSTPQAVSGITNAVSVAAGYMADGSCAVLATGGVDCWGRNFSGQLGNGTTTDSSTPVAVSGITDAIGVSTGGEHSCAVLSTGEVACWGSNVVGQLGNGTTNNTRTPVAVLGIKNARAVSVAGSYSCALLATGAVECWGSNRQGQLGNGTEIGSLIPVPVIGLINATAISTGIFHICAVLSSGGADCWGSNHYGAGGNDLPTKHVLLPIPVIFGGSASLLATEVEGETLDEEEAALWNELAEESRASRHAARAGCPCSPGSVATPGTVPVASQQTEAPGVRSTPANVAITRSASRHRVARSCRARAGAARARAKATRRSKVRRAGAHGRHKSVRC